MTNRRGRLWVVCIALALIGVSVLAAQTAFAALTSAPEHVRAELISAVISCVGAHVLVMSLLLVSLILYLCSPSGTGLDLLCAAMFGVMAASGQYISWLYEALGELPLWQGLLGLYCYALAPAALVLSLSLQGKSSWEKPLYALVPVCIAICLPPFFMRSMPQSLSVCYDVSSVSAIVVMAYGVYYCLQKLRQPTAFRYLGLSVGLFSLLVAVTVAFISRLSGNDGGAGVRIGLMLLGTGIAVDMIRRMLRMELTLKDYGDVRHREEEYRFASRHMRMYIIRYQVAEKRAIFRPDAALAFGLPQNMDDIPESLIDMGRVVESTVPNIRDMYGRIQRGERTGSAVFGVCKKDGTPVWLHTDFTTSFDEEGNPEDSIISSYEIVGMREKEAAYEKWRAKHRELCADSPCACCEVNLTRGLIREWGGKMLGEPPRDAMRGYDALMRHIADHDIDESDRAAFITLCDRERLLGSYEQDVRHETLECHRRAGSERLWTQASVRMISDPYSSDVLGFVMLTDIEEQKRSEARERVRAQTDELTGLLSRVSFMEQLSELCLASGVDACHAVLFIDLDGFKSVNDTFGHRFGDKVLCDVAGDLRAINRSDDLIARLGGDEYILCLKNIPVDTDFLSLRCREIVRALSKQYGDDVAISGSIGVAVYPTDGQTFEELYQHADQAQYSAKQLGRNRFVFYNQAMSAVDTRGGTPREYDDAPRESRDIAPHRHTVLVVDDQKLNRALLHEIFKADYDVLEASGGREALTILRGAQQTISAMVLDLLMPEVSGLDVLREMNRDAYYQSIPVIVVSAADEDEYSLKAIELGAADFVTKPIDERLVLLRVRNAIFRRDSENLRAQNRDLLVQRADEARHQNQLRYLADHDSLTHICNKNAFYRKTHDMIRRRPDTRFCIVSFDVQRFRAVNDIFGHEEGDRLLRFIAMQMRNLIGQDGTFTRADTDNFAFCVAYQREAVEGTIDALIDAMRHYDLNFEVLLSFGIYVIEDIALPVNQMYDRSEMAKRTVKGSYIKRWAYYDDHMRATLLEEQEIVNSMNAALENGEFVVYYQPKCRLDAGTIVGAEALVRWQHPARGILNPGAFIPIFEKNGFIMQLDIYMWEHVCMYLSQRRARDPEDDLRVSVNISRANLYNPNLARTLDGLCRKYGVPNSYVEVEITESAYVENAHLLLGLTDELHRLGFTVEMDDFGSGYSSLNMLKEIPVDVLKLDMRFLYGFRNDGRGGSILKSTVSMARQLHLRVIAEGVENEEQARFLASIGCKQAQGFYYAPPIPQDDFTALYQSRPNLPAPKAEGVASAQAEIDRLLCSAVILARKGSDIRLESANEYYLRMMGIRRETFDHVDALLRNWVDEEDMRTLDRVLNETLESGESRECVYLQRDLHDVHHLLRATVRCLGGDAAQARYLATITDISKDREE